MNVRPGTLGVVVFIVVVGFAIGGSVATNARASDEHAQSVTGESTTHTAARVATAARAAQPAATTAAIADAALGGTWQIDEANVQLGTILWVGDILPARGNTIVFNVHKQSVAGRPATRCERHTNLYASFSLGVADQTVPYREVNCEGFLSTGEIRVTGFFGNGGFLKGSFWRNGVKLGNFTARRL